jgi:hypothetical protein
VGIFSQGLIRAMQASSTTPSAGSKGAGGILGVLGSIIPGWGAKPAPAQPSTEGTAAPRSRAALCSRSASQPGRFLLGAGYVSGEPSALKASRTWMNDCIAEAGPTSIQIITEKNSDDSESEDEGNKKVMNSFFFCRCRELISMRCRFSQLGPRVRT